MCIQGHFIIHEKAFRSSILDAQSKYPHGVFYTFLALFECNQFAAFRPQRALWCLQIYVNSEQICSTHFSKKGPDEKVLSLTFPSMSSSPAPTVDLKFMVILLLLLYSRLYLFVTWAVTMVTIIMACVFMGPFCLVPFKCCRLFPYRSHLSG